jgi:flagellar hook-associated protein 2
MAVSAASSSSSVSSLSELIAKLMALERAPVKKLETQRGSLDVRKAVFNDLKTKLSGLRGKADTLAQTGSLSAFVAKAATSSDTTVVTATATSSAQNTTHTLSITRLATAHSTASNRYTSTDTSISSATTGTKAFDITVNGTAYTVSVTINAGDTDETVLTNVASAINSVAGSATTAAVVHPTSTTSRLTLASDTTGVANKMTFTDTNGLLGLLGVTNATAATDAVGGYVGADPNGGDQDLDAKFVLNGLTFYRGSNTVSDAVTGVTFVLKKTGGSATVTVANDVASVRTKIEEFITSYNGTIDYLNDKLKTDPSTKTRGALVGDTAYSWLRFELRSIVSGKVSTVQSGNPELLSEIGITIDSTGHLSLSDSTKFEAAASADMQKVSDLFNTSSGVAVRVEDLLGRYAQTGGIVDGSTNSVTRQIDNVNKQIDRWEERLAMKEKQLWDEFAALQEALSRIQSQQAFFNSWFQSSSY